MVSAFFGGLFVAFMIWIFGTIIYITREPKEWDEVFTSRVRVPASWHNDDVYDVLFGVADFQLGAGPCGLEVVALEADWSYPNKENFTVTQRCSNGQSKSFHYRREDITGRVEISYNKRKRRD